MNEINILSQITIWLPIGILILFIIIALLVFRLGYRYGIRKALIDPQGDYFMAVFFLSLLEKLEEKEYDAVKDGLAMHTRHYVESWREYEKSMSAKKISEIKTKVTGSELIDNAEKLCGSMDVR